MYGLWLHTLHDSPQEVFFQLTVADASDTLSLVCQLQQFLDCRRKTSGFTVFVVKFCTKTVEYERCLSNLHSKSVEKHIVLVFIFTQRCFPSNQQIPNGLTILCNLKSKVQIRTWTAIKKRNQERSIRNSASLLVPGGYSTFKQPLKRRRRSDCNTQTNWKRMRSSNTRSRKSSSMRGDFSRGHSTYQGHKLR